MSPCFFSFWSVSLSPFLSSAGTGVLFPLQETGAAGKLDLTMGLPRGALRGRCLSMKWAPGRAGPKHHITPAKLISASEGVREVLLTPGHPSLLGVKILWREKA